MSNYCIISEFNPFHNGHLYLIKKAREMGANTITCIMSGNSTQRGELAITDKYLRARAALELGVDLVLELPFPWCSSSAEYFANAGVYIAKYFGDTLFFGSECGRVELLSRAAEYCETSDFYNEYDKRIKNGERSAVSFAECLKEQGFSKISSNDILGIAYIRAINRMGVELLPVTIQRSGAGYNDINTYDGVLPSATSLRKMINAKKMDELSGFMPEPMLRIIMQEAEQERLTDISEADSAVLTLFRLSQEESFDGVAEAQGGIVNRLISASRESASVKELLETVGTKRYTDAKLRRAMLFCLTQTKQNILKELPQYTTLLAANEKGRELLSVNRKIKGISVVTKPADAPRDSEQFVLSERLDTYYAVSRKNKLTADFFFQKSAYVMK